MCPDLSQMPPIPYGRKNNIFTGTKWAAGGAAVSEPFFERACALWDVPASRFEPTTVTRYGPSEYQAKHLDARLPHEVTRNAAYFKTGGQRIAQIIVYLRAPEAGGCTKFYHSAFGGLECPERPISIPAALSAVTEPKRRPAARPPKAGHGDAVSFTAL